MKCISKVLCLSVVLLIEVQLLSAQNPAPFRDYRKTSEVQAFIKNLAASNPQTVKIHKIATSPGGSEVSVIGISKNQGNGPAIFVGANFDGITPLATEGALWLASYLLENSRYTEKVNWYILPCGNPDAAGNFFATPRIAETLNALPVNNDVDEQTDEDGCEDLNGDGFITLMRKKVPDGNYRISDEDPRLLVRADPLKGERGIYRIYTEGTDNDNDGLYNEDGRGGVNPGINFPHDFRHNVKEAGLWPGYAPETFGVMEFIYAHPEIIMTVTLGEANLLLDLPQEGKPDFDPSKIRVTEQLSRQTGLPANETYTLEQLILTLQNRFPDLNVDENMVLSSLNLGPERNFRKNDIVMLESLSKAYKKALSEAGLPTARIPSEKPRSGSFELFSYFHLGVPTIAINLWKPDARRDSTSAPAAQTEGSATVRDGSREKKPTAEKQMLDYFDRKGITGFAEWKPFSHPQLGEVEIGGFIPFAGNTPPAGMAGDLLAGQIPFVAALADQVPDISLEEEKVTPLGAGVYRVEVYVGNKAPLPYPSDMGQRNQQPAPVVVKIDGKNVTILEGLPRTPVYQIAGNQTRKLTWLVRTDKDTSLTVQLESPVTLPQSKTIRLSE